MEMDVEKRKAKIERLCKSWDLLWQSMIKYGCYTRCHGELFANLKKKLEDEGYIIEPTEGTE